MGVVIAALSRVQTLHTHFDQDGFGEEVPIYYALLPLWDMTAATGATAISSGSHRPRNVERINRWWREHKQQLQDSDDPSRFLRPFSEIGLSAGPVVSADGLDARFVGTGPS